MTCTLISGATGKIGKYLVNILLQKEVRFKVLVRKPEQAIYFSNRGIRADLGDFNNVPSLLASMTNVDQLFMLSANGPQQTEWEGNLLHAAKRQQVRKIVKVSAIGAASDAPYTIGKWHATTEALIKHSGIPYTFLQPHSFMQNLLGQLPNIHSHGVILGTMFDGSIPFIHAGDVAAVAAEVIMTDKEIGKTLYLTGPTARTFHEAADLIGDLIGQKIEYTPISPEQYKKAMIYSGVPLWLAENIISIEEMLQNQELQKPTTEVKRILNREARSLEQFIQEHENIICA